MPYKDNEVRDEFMNVDNEQVPPAADQCKCQCQLQVEENYWYLLHKQYSETLKRRFINFLKQEQDHFSWKRTTEKIKITVERIYVAKIYNYENIFLFL